MQSDVPLHDAEVRMRMLKELGAQNDYDPVISADLEGPHARTKRIDEQLARERPLLANVRPASRLATAILLYSFGGLRREGEGSDEPLPSGVTEMDLLTACVDPDLDHHTAESAFRELYTAVWLPRVVDGEFEIEKIEKGGRPLQATGIHERVMELLTSQGAPKVHSSLNPIAFCGARGTSRDSNSGRS